jgi:hypothetical protein
MEFLDMNPNALVDRYKRFGRSHSFYLQDRGVAPALLP